MSYWRTRTFTIASGQTTSGEVDLGEGAPVGAAVETPSALTGAHLAVHAAPAGGGTFKPMYADSAAVSLAIGTSRVVAFGGAELDALSAARYVKFVSDASEGAARSFTLYLRYA
jgi:hypothetical protein